MVYVLGTWCAEVARMKMWALSIAVFWSDGLSCLKSRGVHPAMMASQTSGSCLSTSGLEHSHLTHLNPKENYNT